MISNGQLKTTETYKAKKDSTAGSQFETFEKYNWYIYLQYVHGEVDSCKELINKELERSKGRNEFVLFTKGEIYRKEGKLQEALDSFQSYLKINPQNADCLKEVAMCLYDMKRHTLAVEAFLEVEKYMDKSPDWQVYYYLGQCFMKMGDLNKAKEYANKAVKTGKHELCYAFLIKILTSEGNWSSALSVSCAAVEFCPDSVCMLTECGLLHLKVGQIQEAVDSLRSALALDSNHKKALLAIGYITQKHGDFDGSLANYKMAIQLEPDSFALWNNIGLCFYSKQKFVASISCLKRSLWIQPLNWKTLFNTSVAYLATLQPASAFNFACASVNLRPDIAESFNLLAATLLELDDPSNASQAVKRAVILAPADGITVLNAALCSYIAELIDEAVKYLKQFQKIIQQNDEPSWLTQEVQYMANVLAFKLKPHISLSEETEGVIPDQNLTEENIYVERALEDDEV